MKTCKELYRELPKFLSISDSQRVGTSCNVRWCDRLLWQLHSVTLLEFWQKWNQPQGRRQYTRVTLQTRYVGFSTSISGKAMSSNVVSTRSSNSEARWPPAHQTITMLDKQQQVTNTIYTQRPNFRAVRGYSHAPFWSKWYVPGYADDIFLLTIFKPNCCTFKTHKM